MKVLIFAEHDNKKITEATSKLAQAAMQLGSQQGYDIILLLEDEAQNIAKQAAKLTGANKVLVAQNKMFKGNIAENIERNILPIAEKYDAILAIASMNGKNFMPKIAAKLDVMQVSEVIEIIDQNTFKRPIYAGNAIQTVRSKEHKKVITIRETSFEPVENDGNAEIIYIEKTSITDDVKLHSENVSQLERPELTSAQIVVSGGRGLQEKQNFKMIEDIAQKLNAAVGASRAAVDAGFVTNDYQVGQTGKVVAPKLYIAIGISGAIQHLAGMKDSKVIVAINKDEEAPIFQVADYGLVDDLFNALPILKQKLPDIQKK